MRSAAATVAASAVTSTRQAIPASRAARSSARDAERRFPDPKSMMATRMPQAGCDARRAKNWCSAVSRSLAATMPASA